MSVKAYLFRGSKTQEKPEVEEPPGKGDMPPVKNPEEKPDVEEPPEKDDIPPVENPNEKPKREAPTRDDRPERREPESLSM